MFPPEHSFGFAPGELRRVVDLIRPCFDEYLGKFNERKFPAAAYEQLVGAFGSPPDVTDRDIRSAVLWKFGHLIKRKQGIPLSHEALITELQRKWPNVCLDLTGSASEIFPRLQAAIGMGRFVTVSFLLHLLRPSEVPIIDQHNFRAMNHYLTEVRDGWWPKRSRPSEYADLVTLAAFMTGILTCWNTIYPATVPSERQLDRFLMMFGRALKPRKSLASRSAVSKGLEHQSSRNTFEPSTNKSIRLRFGGAADSFALTKLIEHMKNSGRDYIIQGQTNCTLASHPKPHSLDFWLRQNVAANRDSKQAVNEVIDELVSTGLFEEGKFRCPDSGRLCKGIRVVFAGSIRHLAASRRPYNSALRRQPPRNRH